MHLCIYLDIHFLPFFWKEMTYSQIDMYAKRINKLEIEI